MSMTEWASWLGSGNKKVVFLLLLVLVFYAVNGVAYLRAQSITADEGGFMNYAVRLIKGHPERVHPTTDNSKMPVSVLNLLPRAVDQLLHPGLEKNDSGEADIIAGRYVTLFFSMLTLLLIFHWSRELYGPHAALFSVFLASFCPNLLANAGLVTTDSYSALFLLATIYALWKFCSSGSMRYFIAFSVLIALSQLVKQSLFHLYVISAILLLVKKTSSTRKMFVTQTLIFMGINWLIINLGFYFRDTNTLAGQYHFTSDIFIWMQQLLPSWLPVPFPHAFVTGLDMAKYYDQIGGGQANVSSFGNVTILGRSSTGGSFWYYYAVSLFYKTPVSSLLFLLTAVVLLAKRGPVRSDIFLLVPVVYFILYMSFLYHTQCGIRQLIFVYPLLYVFCGSIVGDINTFFRKRVASVMCLFLVISVMQYWRNYYPYTNECIPDKKTAYGYVGASNLEFLQGGKFFASYLDRHPEVKPAPATPSAGVFLINTNDYLDIWNLHRYDWISQIKPSGLVAYNGLLITVSPADLDHLNHSSHDQR